jgi:hypothetical protein
MQVKINLHPLAIVSVLLFLAAFFFRSHFIRGACFGRSIKRLKIRLGF